MDEERIKQAVLSVIERTDFAGQVARAVQSTNAAADSHLPSPPARGDGGEGKAQKLLTRIVLGDILDDTILGARPQDRTFPLRLLFSELGTLLTHEGDEGPKGHAADLAFTFASGINFFFRAAMDAESKLRVGFEVSRQLYLLAHDARLDPEVVAKAAPLLATMMTTELERLRFETVDHAKVFDSSVHERTTDSDPTGSRILRPASFLCRVATNNAVKAKAQVVT